MSASRIFSTYLRARCTSNHMCGLSLPIVGRPSVSVITLASFFLSRRSGSAHLSRSSPFWKNSDACATFLLSSGFGSHVEEYEPKPEDSKKVAQASLFIQNGLDLDKWAEPLLRDRKKNAAVVTLTDGLPTIGNDNPHMWFDVQR